MSVAPLDLQSIIIRLSMSYGHPTPSIYITCRVVRDKFVSFSCRLGPSGTNKLFPIGNALYYVTFYCLNSMLYLICIDFTITYKVCKSK